MENRLSIFFTRQILHQVLSYSRTGIAYHIDNEASCATYICNLAISSKSEHSRLANGAGNDTEVSFRLLARYLPAHPQQALLYSTRQDPPGSRILAGIYITMDKKKVGTAEEYTALLQHHYFSPLF